MDLLAAEAKCHDSCRNGYTRYKTRDNSKNKETLKHFSREKHAHDNVFALTKCYVKDTVINEKKVVTLAP